MLLKRILLLCCFCLFMISCGKDKSEKVIKLAHGLDVNHSVHRAMVYMGDELDKISGGKMRVEVYPNQQLGTERECLELLQLGSLDMTKVSAAVMENFAPKMKVFGLPYLFRDKEHTFSILDGEVGKEILDNGIPYRLKGLGYYDSGSRSFYSKDKPIETPADLQGMKIRVLESVTAMDMVRTLGGSPTPISWGELYTALQQGVVDGAENNPPSFYLSKHYEVCKYYSIDEHTVLPDVLVVGTDFWNRLNEQERKWLQEAADKSVQHQRGLWEKSTKEALEKVIEAGVQVSYPDKSLFENEVDEMYEKYGQDELIQPLIQKIKQG